MDYSLTLSLAGIPIYIYSENKLITELIRYAFKGFVASEKGPLIKIRILIDEDIKDTNAYSYGHPHHTSVVEESGRFFSRTSTYKGVFDIDSLTGEVRQGMAVAPVYLYLRFILSVYLPSAGGFILHSTSIAKGDKCFFFSGRPQSGKSTVAKLSAGYNVLSDDFSIIRKADSGFCGYGSPFWGHVEAMGENINHRQGRLPVSGVYFLKQDSRVYKDRIDKKEAVRQLMQNTAVLAKDSRIIAMVFQLADEFTDKVPVFNLHFKQDNSFWRCVENDPTTSR